MSELRHIDDFRLPLYEYIILPKASEEDNNSRLFVTKPSVREPRSEVSMPGTLKNTGIAQIPS